MNKAANRRIEQGLLLETMGNLDGSSLPCVLGPSENPVMLEGGGYRDE